MVFRRFASVNIHLIILIFSSDQQLNGLAIIKIDAALYMKHDFSMTTNAYASFTSRR